MILIGFFGFEEAVGVVEVDGVGVAVWAVRAAFRVGGGWSCWLGLRGGGLRADWGGWLVVGCGGGNGERSFATLRMTNRGMDLWMD